MVFFMARKKKIDDTTENKDLQNLPDPMVNKNSTFFGNPLLKKEREPMNLTKEHIIEIKKCMDDPVYFAERYMKIVNVDTGLQTIKLYPYQKKLIKGINEHRNSIILSCRQSGKCDFRNTIINIKNKKFNDGKPIAIKVETLYNWVKFKNTYKEILENGLEYSEEDLSDLPTGV